MGFLEFLRGRVTETAANTFTEVEITTPASRTESLAMLIHQVKFATSMPDTEDAQQNTVETQLTKTTQSAIINIDNDAQIDAHTIIEAAGVVQGSLSEYYRLETQGIGTWRHFHPAILYPRAGIFLGVQGTGNANARTGQIQIGYTLERVSKDDFIAALVD